MSAKTPYPFPIVGGAGAALLKAIWAVANRGHVVSVTATRSHAAACVAAALADTELFSVLHGREGVPCAIGSVLAGRVVLCLNYGVRSAPRRVIPMHRLRPLFNGMAVTRDGATLLVADHSGGSDALHAFRVTDGSFLKTVGGAGTDPLQFKAPCQVSIADDGYIFIADFGNHRVQVLTPQLDFHAFIGVNQLFWPYGVCANDSIVAATDAEGIFVFDRVNGGFLRQFSVDECCTSSIQNITALCFVSQGRKLAVAGHPYVGVYSFDGEFSHHVFRSENFPTSVVCSSADEIIVGARDGVFVFNASGELLIKLSMADTRSMAVHGNSIFIIFFTNAGVCQVYE